MDVVAQIELVNLLHLECLSVGHSEVFAVLDHLQVVHEADKFSIVFVIFERGDWNAVRELGTKAVDCVIYDKEILEVTSLEDTQVLNVYIVIALDAMVSVQSMLNELVLRIDIV